MPRPYILKRLRERREIITEAANKSILRDRAYHRKIPKKDIRLRLLKDDCGYTISTVTRIFVNPSTCHVHCTNCLVVNSSNIYPTKNKGKMDLSSRRVIERHAKDLETTRQYQYSKRYSERYVELDDAQVSA